MMKKRGQAAMEFLMTYGWALLVVLVAIGALAFFGVLSPAKFLPSVCTISPGLHCNDFKVDGGADTITINVQNGLGSGLATVTLGSDSCGTTATPVAIPEGDSVNVVTDTCGGSLVVGERYSGADDVLTLSYQVTGGLPHSKVVNLVSQVEA
ncbi:MAG: hypothetical protein Q8Q42_00035 [Nanoarchaeota archaeon]|nr:hypothetical protein [Nanoarchaeota archaeon]